MSANTHSGTALAMIEATSPGRKPLACRPNAMSLEICSHSCQLVGCQMPNFFSRIAARSPRVSTDFRKLLAIVSATVSTAGLAMLSSSLCRLPQVPVLTDGLAFSKQGLNLALTHSERHAFDCDG